MLVRTSDLTTMTTLGAAADINRQLFVLSYTGSRVRGDYVDYSGYLSEGGTSAYARRMQQKFKEGMQLVKECLDGKYLDADDDR